MLTIIFFLFHHFSTGPLVGLFGAKIAEIILFMCFKTKDSYVLDGVHQLLAILFTLFFVSLLIFLPFVEWGGHFGGFLTGFIIGMFVFTRKLKYGFDKKIWFGCGTVMFIVTSFMFFTQLKRSSANEDLANVCEYYVNIHPENYDCQCVF